VPQVLAAHVTLKGEIIDPKCYLGAMKPGGGKTHKACAMLCISGGVPPMLVTRDANEQETFYLLTTDQGGVANELVLPFVGDRVEVAGRLEEHGDLLLLRIVRDGLVQKSPGFFLTAHFSAAMMSKSSHAETSAMPAQLFAGRR